MNDPMRVSRLDDVLRDWASCEARQPVRFSAGVLLLKAELARADRRRAAAARVERWAFGVAGVFLLSLCLADLGQLFLGPGAVVPGALAWGALAAGWAFSRAIQA